MKFIEVKDLLVRSSEIEFTEKEKNFIYTKIKNTPYILYVDYNCHTEMNNDYFILSGKGNFHNISSEISVFNQMAAAN